MKNADLVKIWGAPDNTRLTAKQFSFRLPVHVAARISALSDLFPNKTRTEIIGDLLSTALEDIERTFPSVKGEYFGMDDEEGNKLYLDAGKGQEFITLTNRYYAELEKELGNESPSPFFTAKLLYSE